MRKDGESFVRLASLAAFALLVALCAMRAAAQGAPAAEGPRPWNVVLLRNWDSLYAVNLERERGLMSTLMDGAPRRIDVFTEEIDQLRFERHVDEEYAEYLRGKYEGMPIDLVVASGLEPLDFAQRYRDRVWPGTPIAFYGVYEGVRDPVATARATTGVTMNLDYAGTLEVARAMVPDARRLYVVAGDAPADRLLLKVAAPAIIDAARNGLDVRYLVGLTREELLERVQDIDPRSIVLYLSVLRDAKGQISGPDVPTMSQVVARSAAPVFGAAPTQWSRGLVGGSGSRTVDHGRIAGRIARRLLEGEPAESIPVESAPPPACELDARALQRWSLSLQRIPARCKLTNVTVPAWRAYFWEFLAMTAIIVLQFALLWALLMQSRRRRQAELESHARGVRMAQVARLSTVGALTASIAHEINQPMGAILSNAEAAETMLEKGELQPEMLRDILQDIRNEDLRASEVIKRLRKLLSAHEWNPAPLEVNTEVAEALRHVAFDAAKRGVTLLPEFDPATPAIVGDSVNLQQVVINLVMNAMEAVARSPESPREVRVTTRASGRFAEIVVSDRGPGLTPENEARLFEESFTTRKDGMGLGLSIVKTIVEMHGGTVAYESNQPRGAIFRMRLPAIGS